MELQNFISCSNEDINKLLKFTAEIDKMTGILRRNLLIDKSRRENDAEHSWHIAVMAILFEKYAPEGTDIGRAAQMCVVHDLIEIYAGDTFAYDIEANKDKAQREKESADKLFSQLPEETGKTVRSLWEEFDAMKTPDSLYANCMDRIQPLLHNSLTDCHTWKLNGGARKWQIEERMQIVKDTMPVMTEWIDNVIQNGIDKGLLKE